ncbi:MAG: cyclase family protein [Cyclobacteriaceae bacterium]
MNGKRIIDLTLPYSEAISGFKAKPAKKLEKDGWNAQTLEIYSHAGTHMDAPYHFGVSNQTIDDFLPGRFILTCHLAKINVTKDRYLIEVDNLGAVQDKIQPGEGLILQTGWSQHLGQPRYREGLPRISEGLAKWIVEKQIKFLGVEPPSVADVNDLEEVTRIHRLLLGGDVIIVEGLTNLEFLSQPRFTVIALPLKIKDGDGAPARVIAIEE